MSKDKIVELDPELPSIRNVAYKLVLIKLNGDTINYPSKVHIPIPPKVGQRMRFEGVPYLVEKSANNQVTMREV